MSDEQVRLLRAKAVKHATDLRMLATFVVVIVAMVAMLTALQVQTTNTRRTDQRFERSIVANCQSINKANMTFNAELDQLARNAQNSTGITAAQKAQALTTYRELHLPISVCPR